ncbi:MAG: nucleotidyltransferase family protein [Deltaproteobacteria bacterium]|nr:nucleotidyltransferase family protein [Deltaproteobacteria bacterium]
MKTREEIIAALSGIKGSLQKKYPLTRLALFGSYARGDQNENSDVDVLVEVKPSIGLEFVTLANQIEKTIGVPTDVVSFKAIKPHYLKIVEAELIDV